MPADLLEYLRGQRVCVLAVEMPDGSPHAATVHFANTDEPVFVFETEKGYRKSEALFARDSSRASMVVGSNESDMRTLQMDGTVSLLPSDGGELRTAYLQKFERKESKLNDPNVVLFSFRPTWWRFTDWTTSEGKKIRSSTDV